MKSDELNPTSLAVLGAIKAFWALHRYSPSVRDLVSPSGFRSISTVAYHLEVLRHLGYITYDDRIARSIVVVRRGQ